MQRLRLAEEALLLLKELLTTGEDTRGCGVYQCAVLGWRECVLRQVLGMVSAVTLFAMVNCRDHRGRHTWVMGWG